MPQYPATIDLAVIAGGDGSLGFVIRGEGANDNSGWSVASAGDINGDGFDDVIVGARDADGAGNARSNAGGSYVIFGAAAGFAAEIDLAAITAGDGSLGFVIHGEGAGDRSGTSVASAGDVNGDGIDDLIVGAPAADGPSNTRAFAGDSYVIFGTTAGFGAAIDLASITAGDGSMGFAIQGENIGDYAGFSVASAGDVNGDGFDDIIVGANYADGPTNSRSSAGDSYVIFGSASGPGATIDLSAITGGDGSLGFVIHGESAGDSAGNSVASAGDLNGDGFDDLIVGARYADGPGDTRSSAGGSYVIFGSASGPGTAIDLSAITAGDGSLGFVIHGEDASDVAGWSVASAGDINGDGFDDIIVGARSADGPGDTRNYAGDSYVVFGAAGGFGAAIDLADITAGDGSQGFVIHGENNFDFSGYSVASAGDVNGDGFDDVIVGARYGDGPGNTRTDAGDSYVIFGSATGPGASIDLANITAGDGSLGFVIHGEASYDVSGRSVASAGDINNDGFDDLIVGAIFADGPSNSRTSAGDSYVVFGRKPDEAVTRTGTNASQTLAGGDFNDVLSGLGGDDDLWGHGGDDELDGGTGNNFLRAGAGNDILGGGEGNDTLAGGTGNDILFGGAGNDALNGQAGTDFASYFGASGGVTVDLRVRIAQSVGADQGADTLVGIENLRGSIHADSFTGNGLANRLEGGDGDDLLNGGGGDDELFGEADDDTLLGGTGNDTLDGGAGNDTLNGGTGNDAMSGGSGNDLYIVDSADDTVSELPGEGTADRVNSLLSHTLAAEVENLLLTGGGAISGTGNGLANRITGNGAANTLDGGEGNDFLTGALGADQFQFSSALGATNIDRILDFEVGVDEIHLDDAIFSALGLGALDPGAFHTVGVGSQTIETRVIYNAANGVLYYDADGSGSGAAQAFAIVRDSPDGLSADDIIIV